MNNLPFKYDQHWLDSTVADSLFSYLLKQLAWQEERIRIYGKIIKVPRLICWMADPECVYRYSGTHHHPHPWDPQLKKLCERLNDLTSDTKFNSVLCNLYQNGHDYMGWHQDNEPELGENPVIASISLGAKRKFSFRHKQTRERIDYLLEHGSLLVMHSNSQLDWEHSLPKSLKCYSARINLTFRQIIHNNVK